MAAYTLMGSYSTVRVLGPKLTIPVEYCTIQTVPSGVVASMPVAKDAFDASQGGPELTAFADAIEQIMARSEVIAGVGEEKIDPNGLISDQVDFTVQYVPPGGTAGTVTAIAEVPAASLNFEDGLIGATLLESVIAIIDGVYANLQNLAGG